MADMTEIIGALEGKIEELVPKIKQAKNELAELVKGTPEYEQQAKEVAELTEKYNRYGSALSTLSGIATRFAADTAQTRAAIDRLHPGLNKLGTYLEESLGVTLKNTAELFGVSLSQSMRSLYSPLDDSTQALGMLQSISKTAYNALLGLHEASKNLITAQDHIRTAVVSAGRGLEEAEQATKTYAQELRSASSATGFAKKDIDEFNRAIGKHLPEDVKTATTNIAEISEVMGQSVMPATVAMTAFRAFGITGSEAARKAEEAILKFNQSSVETARQLGMMQRAAKGLDINLGVAQRQITQASGHLAIFGQKSGAAAGTWRTFMDNLRDNVPIETAGQMVDQLTQSMANMSMQHRAFISMMSGMGRGATALGGALKMELAMRGPEGMQQHLQGLTRTLQRFAGGRIITLERAAQNPQLEQQFILQRQMLQQLTGITTTEQQNRILEVMQGVKERGMSQVEAAGALKEVLKDGKTLQERQLSVLERILQHMRAAFGSRLDVKLDEGNETIRESMDALRDSLQEGAADPTRNVLNRESFFAGMEKLRSGIGTAVQRVSRTRIGPGLGRAGREGVQTLRPDWFERGLLESRMARMGGLPTTMGEGRQAQRPGRQEGRVRQREARRPAERVGRLVLPRTLNISGLRTLSTNVTRGNQVVHDDLQQLIRATRGGFSTLTEAKPAGETAGTPAAPGAGERTITVRVIGDEEKVMNKLADRIQQSMEEFERTQQKNTLGIYD